MTVAPVTTPLVSPPHQLNRAELVRRFVLSEIANDYENVDQIIVTEVAKQCAKLGWKIERSEIADALAGLVTAGLAKAYILSSRSPYATELPDMPALDVIEEDFETYFYITKNGKDFLLSDDTWWPFDDEGELRLS